MHRNEEDRYMTGFLDALFQILDTPVLVFDAEPALTLRLTAPIAPTLTS
jgi:hypothetical protein